MQEDKKREPNEMAQLWQAIAILGCLQILPNAFKIYRSLAFQERIELHGKTFVFSLQE